MIRYAIIVALVAANPLGRGLSAGRGAEPNTEARDAKQGKGPGVETTLRILQGRHLRLVTDVASQPEVDELPRVFDAAVPQWAAYFGVSSDVADAWRVEAFLVSDRRLFASRDLMPVARPDYVNGFASPHTLWFDEQPSAYYRRHLLLHEGTHAFMLAHLGSCGPPWLMEGIAELLGTHQWDQQRLRLGIFPHQRRQTPMWGRIKLLRQAHAENRDPPLADVLQWDVSRGRTTEQYALSWALTTYLENHPRYVESFRKLCRQPGIDQPNEQLQRDLGEAWPDLLVEWDALLASIDYGYDLRRMAIRHRPTSEVNAQAAPFEVKADAGWQSTGWLLRQGTDYQLQAAGRFQVASDPRPWISEADGVTLEYYDGRPLGQLLIALRGYDEMAASWSFSERKGGTLASEQPSFSRPLPLDAPCRLAPLRTGVLYVRINDSPARLGDNSGHVVLTIRPGMPRN